MVGKLIYNERIRRREAPFTDCESLVLHGCGADVLADLAARIWRRLSRDRDSFHSAYDRFPRN